MLITLILHPKVLNETFLRRTRLQARTTGGIALKVVPRSSASPPIAPRFRPMFSLEVYVAESEPYKALAELARAANKWTQYKRNFPPDGGKRVLKELTSRHSDLAHSLKTGLTRNTLLFFGVCVWFQTSSRRLPALQPRRPTKTGKLEKPSLSRL